jgi:dipeptidyl-peptidase-4
MWRFISAALAAGLLCLSVGAATAQPASGRAGATATVPGDERLTPERVFGDPDLNGPRARGVKLSPDGTLVTYLKGASDDQNRLDLWAVNVKGGEPFKLIDAKSLQTAGKELSEAEQARRERMRLRERGVIEYSWDDEGKFLLVPLDGDLYLADRTSGQSRRLSAGAGDKIDAKVSPHGKFVSYVRNENLYVLDLASGREEALSSDGKDTLSWGVAEFIAQEEMARFTGYWWSPDERHVALTRVDESGVDIVPRFDIGADGVKVVQQRYPRAGRPNAVVELYVAELATGKKIKVDLGSNPDIYLARVAWSKDAKSLYVQRQTRDQKTLDLLEVDPATGSARVILTETSPHWVQLNDDFRPLKDGTFLWSSERSGFKHLYLYDRGGKLIRQVTSGDWPVDDIAGVDEAKGLVLFAASRDDVLQRQLYAVSYAKPGKLKQLTAGEGWWSVTVAKTGGAFAGTYSDPHTPPRTGFYTAEGKLVRWVEPNALDATHPLFKYAASLRTPEYGTLKAADGEALHYAISTPPGFDPSKKYPAIVLVYGGPGSQTIKKQWGSLSEQLLLGQGYVVFRLDNRGSPNRSVGFKTALDRRLGTVEVEDQLAGARWLAGQPFVDPRKIAVQGWSYGGFMTLMLLTAPDTPFAAGMSGAPPSDWRLYDTHYTEQFMGQPNENPAGYRGSEIVPRLDRLKAGSLLLLQGMADDNVTFDNSTRVMAALQAKSIPFELMDYPGERHGLRGSARQLHLWRTYLEFLRRKIGSGS